MAKYEAKTKPTKMSPIQFIAGIEDESLRSDCRVIMKLMKSVTGEPPKMWGPSIIGFGSYHYKYASGHEGDACLVGFAPRKPNMVLYVMAGFTRRNALLAKLGKHKTGKACLYIRSLKDIDMQVLESLVTESVRYMRELYPKAGE